MRGLVSQVKTHTSEKVGTETVPQAIAVVKSGNVVLMRLGSEHNYLENSCRQQKTARHLGPSLIGAPTYSKQTSTDS